MQTKRSVKLTLGLVGLALAAGWAPGAHAASTQVCNEARSNHPGTFNATDGDRNPPARFQQGLQPIGDAAGLVHAAAQSPALSACSEPPPPPPPGDGGGDGGTGGGGGGDTGGGGGGGTGGDTGIG